MTDIPVIKSRNMLALMQSVVDTHAAIRGKIREHADAIAEEKRAHNEAMNANALLKTRERKP